MTADNSEALKNGALLVGTLVVAYALYEVVTLIKDLAKGTKDIAKGDKNLLGDSTEGTAYAGKGIAGSLGSTADVLSGGTLSATGSWIGTHLYDLFNPAPTGQSNIYVLQPKQ